jgi:secondary thiamine-phosphate synthase enzyme
MPSTIRIETRSRNQMVDITDKVQEQVLSEGIKEGLCMVYVPHTTAGVTINEGADPAVCRDILNKLEELVPPHGDYRHLEGNADSHVKASLMGSSAAVTVERGRLVLGTWQKIFFCEFDGPRTRKALVAFFS